MPAAITVDWLDRVRVPRKATVWFENSAHVMMGEEPECVLAALLEHVRPAAR